MKTNLMIFLLSVLMITLPIKPNDFFDDQEDDVVDLSDEDIYKKLLELKDDEVDFDKLYDELGIEPKAQDVQPKEQDVEKIVDNLMTEDLLIGNQVIIKDIKLLLKLENCCEVITCLVKRGLNVNTQYYIESDKHVNLLYLAACLDNKELVELLVEKGANVNDPNYQGWVPLFVAIGNKNKEMADFLLRKGASINYISKDNKTPICFAMDTDHEYMREWLIQRGANTNECNVNGNIALQHAVEQKNRKAVKVLLKEGLNVKNEVFALNLAIASDALPIAKLLIKSGVDINRQHKHRETPLGVVAYTVNLMLSYGMGISYNMRQIIKLLIKRKVDVNVKINNEHSVLASLIDDLEIAELLLKHGANPNVLLAESDMSLLARLVEDDRLESVKLLLKYGADVNLTLRDGFNALFYAKSKEMAELLFDNGININYQNSEGVTALSMATVLENTDIVEFLISKGANVNTSCFGKSIHSLAKSSGNKEIIDLLSRYR